MTYEEFLTLLSKTMYETIGVIRDSPTTGSVHHRQMFNTIEKTKAIKDTESDSTLRVFKGW